MKQAEMPGASSAGGRRLRRIAAGIALMAGGLLALVWPLLAPCRSWEWTPQRAEDLSQGRPIGIVKAIGADGVSLEREGARPIALIGPVIGDDHGAFLFAEIEAARPGAGRPVETEVRLLWQPWEQPEFRHEDRRVLIGSDVTRIVFDLPAEAQALHRIGVQFPTESNIVVRALRLPPATVAQRLALASRQLCSVPSFNNTLINYVRGPAILRHGLNWYLVALTCVVVCGLLVLRAARGERLSSRAIGAIVLAAWLIGDVQFTAGLCVRVRDEIQPLAGRTPIEQKAVQYGQDVVWAEEAIRAAAPAGSTFAFISDDPLPARVRLAYWLAPERTLVADDRNRAAYPVADFVLVFHRADAAFNAETGAFSAGSGPTVGVELESRAAPDLYLLRRLK